MLDAENERTRRINRELGTDKFKPVKLPSPAFIDQMAGEIVLSDKYIFLYPRKGSRLDTSSYTTGEADAKFYPWNEGVLSVQAAHDAGNLIMRHGRGETGDNYLKMLRSFSGPVIAGVNSVIGAVDSYMLPKILRNGGVPVLYRRLTDIFREPQNQKNYVAAKALADDMGAEVASLFDAVDVQPSQMGTLVIGYLWSSHPNNEHKEAKIREAEGKLNYRTQITTVPESFLKRFM